jgi:hypothetical protein
MHGPPFIKIDGKVHYRRSDLEGWLGLHRIGGSRPVAESPGYLPENARERTQPKSPMQRFLSGKTQRYFR